MTDDLKQREHPGERKRSTDQLEEYKPRKDSDTPRYIHVQRDRFKEIRGNDWNFNAAGVGAGSQCNCLTHVVLIGVDDGNCILYRRQGEESFMRSQEVPS